MARWLVRWDNTKQPGEHRPLWLSVLRVVLGILMAVALIVLTLWGVLPR